MAERRYGVTPADPLRPSSLTEPGFLGSTAAKWRLGWGPSVWNDIGVRGHEPDPSFNPWTGMEGFEPWSDRLLQARSQGEQEAMKAQIAATLRDRDIAGRSEWGIVTDLMAGIADPVNLIPIPIAKGIGLVRGALAGGASLTALTAGSDTLRFAADPTATVGEVMTNIGIAGLLGGGIGGLAGTWGRGQRTAALRLERAIGEVDLANPTLELRASDEGMRLAIGERPPIELGGERPRVSITQEATRYQMKVVDGVNYVYEEGAGWIYASDAKRPDARRPVSPEVLEQLGQPEMGIEPVLRIDEARLVKEFDDGEWLREVADAVPEGVSPQQAIRNSKDYTTFRTLERLWEDRLPRNVDESHADWQRRVRQAAIKETIAGRAGPGYANAAGMQWIMERLNLSPVAKAMRVFQGDNVVADTALRIGGDYGWAIRGNEFGFRTPPSLIMKGMRHNVRWAKFKAEFDAEWLKFTSGQAEAQGRMVQGVNLSASMWAIRRGAGRLMGNTALTYDEFAEMAGRAVYTPGDFQVNGHPVNEFARNAAKAWTRMAEEYEALGRQHGLFKDQKGLAAQLQRAKREELRHKTRVAEWLWGKSGEPAAMSPAIMVEGKVYVGATYDEAIARMVEDLGEEIGTVQSERLTAANYGYVPRRPRAEAMAVSGFAGRELRREQSRLAMWADLQEQMAADRRDAFDRIVGLTEIDLSSAMWSRAGRLIERFMAKDATAKTVASELEALMNAGEMMRSVGKLSDADARFIEDAVKAFDPVGIESIEVNSTFLGMMEDEYDAAFRAYGGMDADTLAQVPEEGLSLPVRRALKDARTEAAMRGAANDPMATTGMADAWKSYDPEIAGFRSLGDALEHVRKNGDSETRRLIKRIWDDVSDIPLKVLDYDQVNRSDPLEIDLFGNLGLYSPADHRIVLRGLGYYDGESGSNIEVLLHEAIHGATSRRLKRGIADIEKGRKTPEADAAMKLSDFWNDFKAVLDDAESDVEAGGMGLSAYMPSGIADDEVRLLINDLKYAQGNVNEMMTIGLTSPYVRHMLQQIPDAKPNRTMWDRFKDLIAQLLGLERTYPMLQRLDRILDDFGSLEQRRGDWRDVIYGSDRMAARENVSRETSDFITQDQLIEQRVASLSEKQRAIYEERKAAWDMAKEFVAQTEARLKDVNENPHRFLDANGAPEPYLSRYFDTSEISTRREAFTRLIERWYERDEADGARARAEETVDRILKEDYGTARSYSGMRALNQRALNIPNSWSIEDPELGTVALADFIDNNLLAISETYVRRIGVRIEAAKAFGDADLKMEFAKVREHLAEQYFDTLDENAPDFKEQMLAYGQKVGEVMGWLDLTARSVFGTLRTSDPWRWDNRTARAAMDYTSLSVMGKVALTAAAELGRAGMVNGIGTAFRAIFMRYLDDLEAIRPNIEFARMTGEVNDMAMTRANMRIAEMNAGESTTGGLWFERELAKAIPGFFKLVGLTQWTVWAKEWTMLAAQHAVMADAQRIASRVRRGLRPTADDALRLAALGINERDALLLASMPVEVKQGGKLIMPAIQNWTGVNGRQAAEKLLTAIHAEARRAIVTPAVADKSTVFSGVWSSGGKVKYDSDLMRLPMQFLSYGIAAHNKLLVSAMQGRDRSAIGGVFFLLLGGIFSNWLKSSENAWRNKDYDEILLDAWESAGINGFWFGDLNSQVERFTGNRVGLRPLLGQDPKFGKKTDVDGMIDVLGSAPSLAFDVSRAFWDSELSASQRAQLIRRGIPYNNVLWWNRLTAGMAGEAGRMFEGTGQ